MGITVDNTRLPVTSENYYSPDMESVYMSCSQYLGWLKCEAAQKAALGGIFVKPTTDALIAGNYFHSYFEGAEAHNLFVKEKEAFIYKKRGAGKYSAYEQIDEMIEVAKSDAAIKSFIDMPGKTEEIMTGELFGVPWKIRIDKYIQDARIIIDWKTTKSIWGLAWDEKKRQRVSFVEEYNYMLRAAVYTAIERQRYGNEVGIAEFLIIAISKEMPPDKAVISLTDAERYEEELEDIRRRLGRIINVKEGREKPERCGICAYCRETKKIQAFINYKDLALGDNGARECEKQFIITNNEED